MLIQCSYPWNSLLLTRKRERNDKKTKTTLINELILNQQKQQNLETFELQTFAHITANKRP